MLLRLCAIALLVAEPARAEIPSFLNDVVPILTRQGCNQGACHGKGAGQNGFRLSLRGYAPESDYRWITREFNGRRIETGQPEMSLLLRKPIGDAPHEGGRVFGPDSREYAVILEWLRAGAPGPNKNDPQITRLDVSVERSTMKPGERQQLRAFASFSNGQRRDVTWLAKFESNDPGILDVDAEGRLMARRSGESAIRVAFLTEVAVAVITVPFETSVDPKRYTVRPNGIDEHVFSKLQTLRIEPSDRCSDAEFIRRVMLDATGTLPSADEVREFLKDTQTDKRAKLIDRVLDRPEFVDYWTLILGDLLQNRKERDHDVRGVKGVRSMHTWLREQVAANRPWNQLAQDVLTATGTTTDQPQVGYFIVTVGEHRHGEQSEVVSSVAQAFLGTRIGCAQCHNHPLEKYTQDDYYHFAAFFSRVKLDRQDPRMGPTRLRVSHPDINENKRPVGVHQPRTGQFLKPQPLDRSAKAIAPGEDPRTTLANWVVDPQNEYFSGAMVNRIWKHYLGVGLVEPVDDLRATNPPTNPELWKSLSSRFVGEGFDLKKLMRSILNSETYQLSSATRSGNETETRFYSHYYARRLPAEVLLDAISQVTGLPDRFPGYPYGMRAIQLPDPGLNSYFLSLFGRSDRVTACACERNGEVTMPQLLHLQNGEAVIQKIRSADSRLGKLLSTKKDDDQIIEELCFITLSRPAHAAEKAAVRKLLQAGDPREEVFRDLFWALINSKDFAFNH